MLLLFDIALRLWVLLCLQDGLQFVHGQINLGTINLRPTANGDLDFGIGQGVNILGFGADRELMFTVGPGRFDSQLGGGALVGGERVGWDSGLGLGGNQGFNLGSAIKFGNQPTNTADPAGQLNTFINNVGYFFQRFAPPRGLPPPGTSLPVPPRPSSSSSSSVNNGGSSSSSGGGEEEELPAFIDELTTEPSITVSRSSWLTPLPSRLTPLPTEEEEKEGVESLELISE